MMESKEKKQWTLMFYFGSDNALAPGIVSQLKALKNAGFHPEVNVIAHFDPFTPGTPTHVFDVNLIEKLRHPGKARVGFIGDGINNPFIRNLMEDKLWKDQKGRNTGDKGEIPGKTIRELIKGMLDPELAELAELATKAQKAQNAEKPKFEYNPPEFPPDQKQSDEKKSAAEPNGNGSVKSTEPGPKDSLAQFLNFCGESYPAHHYMLFILGHGLVVGNDVFLFDDHTDQLPSLSLTDLRGVLQTFKDQVTSDQFELVSFHSCSMSSAEVAYELEGTANYMLASQSPAFVGSWPYRQILMRIFNDVDELKKAQDEKKVVRPMIKKIADYCFHNGADFILAGYSYDQCLCSLEDITRIKSPIQQLCKQLNYGLDDPLAKNLILLAHLRSQSFYQESYTDLFDFCFCLNDLIREFKTSVGNIISSVNEEAATAYEDKLQALETSVETAACHGNKKPSSTLQLLQNIQDACETVTTVLEGASNGDGKPIISSRAAGPGYQFAHGLSIFFPWSSPLEDSPILKEYEQYKFNDTCWLKFLKNYFVKTMRDTRKEEEIDAVNGDEVVVVKIQSPEQALSEDIANLVFCETGQFSRSGGVFERLDKKTGPQDPTGDDTNVFSIKNFPRDTRARVSRGSAITKFSVGNKDYFRDQ